jgi:CBS domain-containing protein
VSPSTVGEIMTSDVLLVEPSDTIGETAQKMVERGVSSAVVSDYGTLIGIVTERDLTRAVAGRVHTSEARVREWMTSDPITLGPNATADEAAKIMLDNGFRHVPIVDEGRAVGIVSIRDVARWSTEEG